MTSAFASGPQQITSILKAISQVQGVILKTFLAKVVQSFCFGKTWRWCKFFKISTTAKISGIFVGKSLAFRGYFAVLNYKYCCKSIMPATMTILTHFWCKICQVFQGKELSCYESVSRSYCKTNWCKVLCLAVKCFRNSPLAISEVSFRHP